MTCNICGQNEATIHLTEIVNEQMVEIHLCETCAQEKGTDFKTHFNFSDLLSGLSSPGSLPSFNTPEQIAPCPECGLSYEEFGKTGRLGCPQCYSAFEEVLLPLIKRVQRSTHHIGKKTSHLSETERKTYDLRLLQDQLRKSIELEEFEEAAKIRDQIKKMEVKAKKNEKDRADESH